jgi:hypothetical protein
MARQAIRNEGAGAERAFLGLVAKSRLTDSAKRGDAIVSVDGADNYIEIKYVTSNTVNQVRAIKFIPLVIYSPQHNRQWAVLPAHEVVRLVFQKDRGQHTEIALECANMTLSGVPAMFRFDDDGLSDAVHTAIRDARKYSLLAAALPELLQNIRVMNESYRKRIEIALQQGDAA